MREIDSCHCDSRYVGGTSQRLQHRIKQHVPKSIRCCCSFQKHLLPARRYKSSTQTNIQFPASYSAIGLHLSQSPTCAQHYDDSRFSILAQGCSFFHLSALEVKSSQVYLTIRKNTQEGHSEKTTRSSRSTAPLWQYFYTYGGKLNLKK